MKNVYLMVKNGKLRVHEILSDEYTPVSDYYGEAFAKQCVEAPDNVEEGMMYDVENDRFYHIENERSRLDNFLAEIINEEI